MYKDPNRLPQKGEIIVCKFPDSLGKQTAVSLISAVTGDNEDKVADSCGVLCKVILSDLFTPTVRLCDDNGRIIRGSQEQTICNTDIIGFMSPEQLTTKEKKQLINYLVSPEMLGDFRAVNYQLSFLNKLLERYPNVSFWRVFSPGFKVKNLVWYLSGDGAAPLEHEYNLFKLDLPEPSVNMEEMNKIVSKKDKVGQDIVDQGDERRVDGYEKKYKNVIDFLL